MGYRRRLALLSLSATVLLLAIAASDAAPAPAPASADTQAPQRTEAVTRHRRVKRQNGEVVESIFQIPITTLQAVSKVFTTSIQSFQRQREAFFQATMGNRPGSFGSSSSSVAPLYSGGYVPQRPSYSFSRPQTQSASTAFSSAYSSFSRPGAGAGLGSAGQWSNFSTFSRPPSFSRPRAQPATSSASSSAAAVSGLKTQADGSSYRI